MQMDELACFAPGMLALGSSGYGPDDSQKIFTLAEEVFVTSFKSRLETIACLVWLLVVFVLSYNHTTWFPI